MSFCQRAVIEFLVKEGNSEAGFTISNDKAWNGIRPYRPKIKSRKQCPRPAGKFMGTVFWNSDGCKLVDFLEKGEKINAARYVQTLNKLRRAFREKFPKKKTVILQHDNARPHTARLTLQTIQKNG
jgi:hypothetical protein